MFKRRRLYVKKTPKKHRSYNFFHIFFHQPTNFPIVPMDYNLIHIIFPQ